jgi:hypothetical protein
VTAGQSVTAKCQVNPNNSGANLGIRLNLAWYDSGSTLISRTQGVRTQQGSGYREANVTGNAPANATKVKAEVEFATGTNPPGFGYADLLVLESGNARVAEPVSIRSGASIGGHVWQHGADMACN